MLHLLPVCFIVKYLWTDLSLRLPDHPTAADVLNTMAEDTLSEIIKVYGQEVMAKEIAQAIAEHRKYFGNIQSTKQLADIVSSATRGLVLFGVEHPICSIE